MGAILATPITIFLALITAKPSDIIFWCKWIISYIYVELFKRQTKSRFDLYDMEVDHDPYKVAFLPHPEEITLESPLPESQLCNNADELFFYGMNSKSENLTVRLARNSNQEAEAWIYMKLSNGKIYQLLETTGYQQSGCDKKIFSCGGLQLQYLSPMRRWRIFYNGILRETSENDETSSRTVHVKFAFLWRASSDAFDFISDVDSKALATGLAQAKWNQSSPPLEKLHSALNFYAQSGIIMGTVNVEGVDEEFDLYLFGERLRYLGDVSSVKGVEFSNVFGHVFKNGRNFFVAEVSIENVVKNLVFGFVTTLNGNIRELKDTKSVLRNLSDKEKDENDLEAKFHADGKLFDLKGKFTGKQNKLKSHAGWAGKSFIDCFNFEVNTIMGRGIVMNGTMMKPAKRNISKASSEATPSVIPLVVSFSEKICQLSDATGGKGSSLGKLTELSKEFQNFVVPNGVVVTTSAYESFVTKEIAEEIKKLEKVLYSDKLDETKKACLSVMAEITNSPVPKHLLEAVTSNLEKVFPDKKHDRKFAVRSSATGEDTEQMSAAGQMDTYLGLTGMDEIMTAIKKCWASQFSYIAVQYKRQNGQIINSPMAVVVQQMISCDVAGVLFTCDPLTGNPTSISITANYGLGESVVSGSEEPDTIEIERQSEQELVIKNIIIGSKSHRIVVKEDGGTSVEDVSENEKQSCCITNAMALRLAHLAVKIEKSYGSYRDIEWGFWNNNLYIFQSRPVTSGTGETDFEIDHEFDAPLRCENDYFTMCNVGEVMPGATSTLGLDIILKYFNIGFQRKNFVEWPYTFRTTYYPRGLIAMYSHIMFYCVDLFQRINENPSRAQANAVGLFGRTVEDEELFEMSIERHKDFPKAKLFTWSNISSIYRMFLGARQYLNKNIRRYEGYHIPLDKCKTSQEVFDQLMYRCSDLTLPMGSHMICSESSGFWNMIILLTLQKAAGEMNADVYSDFAQLATTSDEVQSADVPSAMELLAYHISKEIDPEDFKNMSVEDALEWLEKSSTKVSKKYREFLERHGHRCLREFDIHSFTWRMDPKDLVKLLQNLVGCVKSDREEKKVEESPNPMSELKSPLTFKDRLLLKSILPLCRQGVHNRENSKSLMMRVLNEWRKGYRKLAKTMVLEGRIPDEDILFYMTIEDIDELIKTRSPKIISKANHRRRRHPVIDKYIFPELIKGFPIPVNMGKNIVVSDDSNFSMKGIPVSQGSVVGNVRVALDLEEASLLQPGEILVTYSTDIGWSPYFPILGGVVTELGGLISHGAVVSREYGLPCVAGLHGATHQFQTGDYVLLDGTKGIIQRLPKQKRHSIF